MLTDTQRQIRELRTKARNQRRAALRLEQRARWERRDGTGTKLQDQYQNHLTKACEFQRQADELEELL